MQLDEEFTEIRSAIIAQNEIRQGYIDAFGGLITTLEDSGPAADDSTIREALDAARSVGRLVSGSDVPIRMAVAYLTISSY